jgi:hypothetical protein
MEAKPLNTYLSYKVTLAGLALAVIGFFLPWFTNPKVTGSGLDLIGKMNPLLPIVNIICTVIAVIGALAFWKATAQKSIQLSALIRSLALIIGLLAIAGTYRVLTNSGHPPKPLTVATEIGTYFVAVGILLALGGTITDYLYTQAKHWSTVDLVLIVMCAALYGAALLTLSFIKLAPGTWLRPGNALQAPFGILFGIPGCIGIALGNLLADLNQGMAPHQMVLGLLSNFLCAFLPYLFVSNAMLNTRRSVIEWFIWAVLGSGVVVAGSIWINVALGLTPQAVALAFSPITFLNNAVASALLGPPLIKLLYPFVVRAGLYRGREAAMEKKDKK